MSSLSCPRRHDGRASPCHLLCMPPAKKTPKVRRSVWIYLSCSLDAIQPYSPQKISSRLDFYNPTPTFNDSLTLRISHTLRNLFRVAFLGRIRTLRGLFVRISSHLIEFRQQTPSFVYYKLTKQMSHPKSTPYTTFHNHTLVLLVRQYTVIKFAIIVIRFDNSTSEMVRKWFELD
jgi:hypothetical protein